MIRGHNVHSILALLSNCQQKSGWNWVLKIEYSISPNSELKLSAQFMHFFHTIIEYSINPNSELGLSTQYLNFLPLLEYGICHEHPITDIYCTLLSTQYP